jgi:hypothetical protein
VVLLVSFPVGRLTGPAAVVPANQGALISIRVYIQVFLRLHSNMAKILSILEMCVTWD